jgi:LAO/AO transport system ATPase
VVAVTGSAGVGKSSLIGKLLGFLRDRALTVAVLACDPQSPLSGGALLGDRFRMPARADDDGVFIRSLAAPPGKQAIAGHIESMVLVLETFGFDVILIETAGAGQGDTAVHELADVVVLLLQPETGDDLQWEKAGLLEVAEVVAIHKADLPSAEHLEAQVRAAVALPGARSIPVVRVSSKTGAGLDALWDAIAACSRRRAASISSGQDLLQQAQRALADWFNNAETSKHAELGRVIARWRQGELPESQAVRLLFQLHALDSEVDTN